jgi:hypothetical protein
LSREADAIIVAPVSANMFSSHKPTKRNEDWA